MRSLARALGGALLASSLLLLLPAAGQAAVGEVAAPPPASQAAEQEIGLSPMPLILSPAPRFERQASFVGPETGNDEHDTYGFIVTTEERPRPENPSR